MSDDVLYFSFPQITLQEVPDEISLAMSISGCQMKCKGCHSSFTWNKCFGEELTDEIMHDMLKKNMHATCVLFYGGEWEEERLLELYKIVKSYGFKICHYTGLVFEKVSQSIKDGVDFLKVGPYIAEKGPLNSKTTNQVFYKKVLHEDTYSWEDTTSAFWGRFS